MEDFLDGLVRILIGVICLGLVFGTGALFWLGGLWILAGLAAAAITFVVLLVFAEADKTRKGDYQYWLDNIRE